MKIKYRHTVDKFLLTIHGAEAIFLNREQLLILKEYIEQVLKEQDYARELMEFTKGD